MTFGYYLEHVTRTTIALGLVGFSAVLVFVPEVGNELTELVPPSLVLGYYFGRGTMNGSPTSKKHNPTPVSENSPVPND